MDASLDLKRIASLYVGRTVNALSYGTVRDFCDSFDNLQPLATANGDLKDCQRPWMFKTILSKIHGNGRLLEIGAGEPLIAGLLQQLGHEVWIVDPYDGAANGPTELSFFRSRYPDLKFVPEIFDDHLSLKEKSFDCIYSVSVLEHVPTAGLDPLFAGLHRFLKPDGVTIHAIDHVLRGHGDAYHLENLRVMIDRCGFRRDELEGLVATLLGDPDTYYLSAESHNRWRHGVAYDQFPMRVCVSIQVVAEAARLRAT